MLLLDSEAISAMAHGPTLRRDRVRAIVMEMRGGAIVATCDPDDLRRLAAVTSRVRIAPLDP